MLLAAAAAGALCTRGEEGNYPRFNASNDSGAAESNSSSSSSIGKTHSVESLVFLVETSSIDTVWRELGHGATSLHHHLPESLRGRGVLGELDGKAADDNRVVIVAVELEIRHGAAERAVVELAEARLGLSIAY